MNKMLLTLVAASILTGCTTTVKEDNNANESVETTEEITEEEATTESEEQMSQSASKPNVSNYGELTAQNVFNPEEYESHLLTDNPGTRVFIFLKDGQHTYKTVYVKHGKVLKVIDLANDKLLMNEQISLN